jgi:hypothetical protein
MFRDINCHLCPEMKQGGKPYASLTLRRPERHRCRAPSETLDVYTHFWPTDEERTREAIGRASTGRLEVAR